MICHQCHSEPLRLSVTDSPVIIDQVEVVAVCEDCGAEHEYSISGGDFELIEPDESGAATPPSAKGAGGIYQPQRSAEGRAQS